MTEKRQPTAEEIEEGKKALRAIALKNLNESGLVDLASAYLVEKSGQYGEAGSSAVEQFKYFPAFNSGAKAYDFKSGEEINLIQNSILSSRQDGRRYTGNVSEYGLIQDSAAIIQKSLSFLKVEDILKLIGSKAEIANDYKDMYMEDLAKKDKELAQNIFGAYMSRLTDTKVSESLAARAGQMKSGLEEILTVKKDSE